MQQTVTRCGEPGCGADAEFTTPHGFRCGPHAMERLARDINRGGAGWMPIRFRRGAASGRDRPAGRGRHLTVRDTRHRDADTTTITTTEEETP